MTAINIVYSLKKEGDQNVKTIEFAEDISSTDLIDNIAIQYSTIPSHVNIISKYKVSVLKEDLEIVETNEDLENLSNIYNISTGEIINYAFILGDSAPFFFIAGDYNPNELYINTTWPKLINDFNKKFEQNQIAKKLTKSIGDIGRTDLKIFLKIEDIPFSIENDGGLEKMFNNMKTHSKIVIIAHKSPSKTVYKINNDEYKFIKKEQIVSWTNYIDKKRSDNFISLLILDDFIRKRKYKILNIEKNTNGYILNGGWKKNKKEITDIIENSLQSKIKFEYNESTTVKVSKIFTVKNVTITKYILLDIILLDEDIYNFICVNEGVGKSKLMPGSKLNLMYWNINQEKEYFIFNIKQYYNDIYVKILNAIDEEQVDIFLKIFDTMIQKFKIKQKEIKDKYSEYLSIESLKKITPEIKKIGKEKLDILKRTDPIFMDVLSYPKLCDKIQQPVVLSKDKVDDNDIESGRVIKSKHSVTDEDIYYGCTGDEYKYIGFREVKLNEKGINKVPCCYKTKFTIDKDIDDDVEKKGTVIVKLRDLKYGKIGRLPHMLWLLFSSMYQKDVYDNVLIYSPKKDNNSFLHAILWSLNYKRYRHVSDNDTKLKIVKEVRLDFLKDDNLLNSSKQECWDMDIEQIKNYIKDEDNIFIPEYFLNLCSEYFKCNIVIFNNILDNTYMPQISVFTPRFKSYYIPPTFEFKNTIVLVKNDVFSINCIYDNSDRLLPVTKFNKYTNFFKQIFNKSFEIYNFNRKNKLNIIEQNNVWEKYKPSKQYIKDGTSIALKWNDVLLTLYHPITPLPIPCLTKTEYDSHINSKSSVINFLEKNNIKNYISTEKFIKVNKSKFYLTKDNEKKDIIPKITRLKHIAHCIKSLAIWYYSTQQKYPPMYIDDNYYDEKFEIKDYKLSIENTSFFRKNKLIVPKNLELKLEYYIKLTSLNEPWILENIKNSEYIQLPFENLEDYSLKSNEQLFFSTDDLIKWAESSLKKFSFQKTLSYNSIGSYFFTIEYINLKGIVQHVKNNSKESSTYISTMWLDTGKNLGYNAEIKQIDKEILVLDINNLSTFDLKKSQKLPIILKDNDLYSAFLKFTSE